MCIFIKIFAIAPQILIMPRIANLTSSIASNFSQPPLPSENSLLNENKSIPEESISKRQSSEKKHSKSSHKDSDKKSKKKSSKKQKITKPVKVYRPPLKNELLDEILPQVKNHLHFMVKLIDRAKRLEENKSGVKTSKTKPISKGKKDEKGQKNEDEQQNESQVEVSESAEEDSLEGVHIEESSNQIGDNSQSSESNTTPKKSIVSMEQQDSFDMVNEVEDEEDLSNSDSSVGMKFKKKIQGPGRKPASVRGQR